jgi:hypothetical protein
MDDPVAQAGDLCAWKEQLGPDLMELIRGIGADPVRVIPLTSLTSPSLKRGSFQLCFSDGRILKGRRFWSEDRARDVEALMRELGGDFLPRVLDRRGTGLLMEWVEGQLLSPEEYTMAMLRACGALQGRIHATEVGDEFDRMPRSRVEADRDRFNEQIDALVLGGALSGKEANRALALAESATPSRFETGPVHLDFCPENIVRSDAGRFVIVDNETIGIDACDYDLARTWYRWPMTPPQRAAYFEGYNRFRSSTEFSTNFFYWAVRAIVDSAFFRFHYETPEKAAPLDCLRRLLAKKERPSFDLP